MKIKVETSHEYLCSIEFLDRDGITIQRRIDGYNKYDVIFEREYELEADEKIVGCYGEKYQSYEGGRLKSFGFVILGAKDAYKDLKDSDEDAEETTEDEEEPFELKPLLKNTDEKGMGKLLANKIDIEICDEDGVDGVPDISDIDEEYRKKWHLMDGREKNTQPNEVKQELADHFSRKLNDEKYREECDKERMDAFIQTDVNKNGQLDLKEWKEFSKKMCENLSKRIGKVITPVSEAQMEVNYEINKSGTSSKAGLTVADFKRKE
jgi:hypothetical protein